MSKYRSKAKSVSAKELEMKIAAAREERQHPDNVKSWDTIMEIVKKDTAWRCEGFAVYVIDKGYGALGPPDKHGNAQTWQTVGRKLFGEAFNTAVKAELERRRFRAGNGSSSSSPSPSLPSSAPSSLPPVDSYSLF